MASNQRIDEFLRLQDKGISLDEIASTLGVKPQTLRRNLNKNGYKSVNGKYIKDKLITPLVKLEPLSSCEGFIIFDNLNNIPKKFNLIINAVPKSKKFKFKFKIDKDFRNQIIK